jgi:endonuclease/exonuclease/phosphatase (EEP) superfamily protein YafD
MRMLVGTLCVLALGGLLVMTVSRFLVGGPGWTILVAAFAPYALLGYAVLLIVCALLVRGSNEPWWPLVGVGVALVGILAHVWWLVPMFTAETPPPGDRLTVMNSNLEFGQGDAATVVNTAAQRDVDVLVLEEATPLSLQKLRDAGLDELLPHQRGEPSNGASGTMVFSRFTLGPARTLPLGNLGLDLTVRAPEPFRLIAVHTAQPVGLPTEWQDDLRGLRTLVSAATRQGPTVLAGDFNATLDHAPLRRVLDAGVSDAVEQSGSGWQPTWPSRAHEKWLRPLITIDHVLASKEYVATRTHAVEVANSDHFALVTELVRRGSSAGSGD